MIVSINKNTQQAEDKSPRRSLVNISNVGQGFSPQVVAILESFYLSNNNYVPPRSEPLAPPRARSSESWNQEDKVFAEKLVGHINYLNKLARFMCRDYVWLEADDLVQTTLEAAWTDRKAHTSENTKAWLATILRYKFYDEVRRKTVQRKIFAEPTKIEPRSQISNAGQDLYVLIQELQKRVLPHLARELKDVLVLRTLGYKTGEITSILGYPRYTVHRYEHLARWAVTQLLDTMSPSDKNMVLKKLDGPEASACLAKSLPRSRALSNGLSKKDI